MDLEIWRLVIPACIAVGAAALTLRYALHVWGRHQLRRLTQETAGLRLCWNIVRHVPVEVLSEPVRITIGAIMSRQLLRAARIQSDHPFLIDQQARIAHFVEQPPAPRTGRPGLATRQSAIAALKDLDRVLSETAADKRLTQRSLVSCRAAVSRKLTELEFLDDQHAVMEADYLRRVTRALDSTNGLWGNQFPDSRRILPTQ